MGRRAIAIAIAVVLFASVLGAGTTHADKKVVLVNAQPLFAAATQKALAPWPITVALLERDTTPSESMPGARKLAHQISDETGGSAVVWLTSNSDGHAIWVYDASDDRVVVRELRVEQPLSEAGAASAALSLKALLMHSHSAPRRERFGATPAEPSVPATEAPLAAGRSWAFEAVAGIQQGLSGNRLADPRLGLGVLRRRGSWEAGARLTLGPGHSIRAPELAGSYTSWDFSLVARYLRELGDYELAVSLQSGLQYSALEGSLLASGRDVDVYRLNPNLGASAELFYNLDSLRLGVGLTSTYMLRSQRYLVSGDSVLDLSEFNVMLGSSIAIWMP